MACALVVSKTLGCLDNVGGVSQVKFYSLPSATTLAADYTLTSGVVTIASGSQNGWLVYDLELETASFTHKGTTNRGNGTFFCDEALTLIVNGMSAEMRNEIQAMGQGRFQVAVKMNNGTYWLAGYQNGLTATTIDGGSGVALGDRNGYTFNLVGKEPVMSPSMSAATYASL